MNKKKRGRQALGWTNGEQKGIQVARLSGPEPQQMMLLYPHLRAGV